MKRISKSLNLYLAAFLVPYLLLLLLHFYYSSGHGNPMMGILQPNTIILNGLASVFFLFYIKNSSIISLKHFPLSNGYQLLFSIAYGMTSYALVQESNIAVLLCYTLFPIVFCAFEYMIQKDQHFYFIVTLTISFIINPNCGAFLFFFFLILTFFELGIHQKLNLANFVHCLSCMVLAFFLAAFRFLPYFESSTWGTNPFNLSYFPDMILSRFLPGSIASIAYASNCGTDVYFGLFFLFPLCMFFTNRHIPTSKRICYGSFTLFLLLSIYVSTLRDFFHMLIPIDNYSVPYSFVIVFWCLKLATEALAIFNGTTEKKPLYLSISIVLLWIAISFIRYSNNVTSFAIPFTTFLFILYTILLIVSFILKKNNKIMFNLLFLITLFELTTNAWLCTDLTQFPSKRSLSPSYFWTKESTHTQTSTDTPTEYENFEPTESITTLLTQLENNVNLTSDEYERLCGTDLPNFFEEYNGRARKLGLNENLFTPEESTLVWNPSVEYQILKQSDILYNFDANTTTIPSTHTISFQLVPTKKTNSDIYLFNNLTKKLLRFTPEQQNKSVDCFITFTQITSGTLNFHVLTYTLNEAALAHLTELINQNISENTTEDTNFLFTYIGIIISCIGLLIFFSLYFNSDKDKVYEFLRKVKRRISKWNFPHFIATHCKNNYVYYIAFLIPVITFISGMIMTNCTPFGNFSFFDEDGIHLTVPSYLDCYYNLQKGNTYLSMNGGYGFNQYANHPLIELLSFWKYMNVNQIVPFLLFAEAICLGLCSTGTVFYLTHRQNGKKARKNDFLLLIPACIYSMNAYMIAMHNFSTWYYTLLLLPILLCALEYMLYKKNAFPYTILLSLCIISNLYLALYICIFLVIYFFTCKFESVTDFINKGIRFASFSLLAAGNSLFIISNTLLSSLDSPYSQYDDILPSFGLHTNFLEQWKKHMIFCKSKSVSSDNGLLNIYCSIFALFLVAIYFSSKKIKRADKLRRIIPITILYISFNEQVLSYLWNGLHYQSMVPNRYAFLLLFILAILSYDVLQELKDVSAKKMLLITLSLISFFVVCQFGSSGNTNLSWIATSLLCIFYLVLHLCYKKEPKFYYKTITFFTIIELCFNSIFCMLNFSYTSIRSNGNYDETATYIQKQISSLDTAARTVFLAKHMLNNGQIYNAETNELFNSYVTIHQNRLNTIYGFHSGNQNYIRSQNSSTPFGMSLSGAKYLFLPTNSIGQIEDLDYYNYLGKLDIHYIFENPYALSYGIFVPEAVRNLENVFFPPMFYNDLASLYTESQNEIFVSQYISYSEDENAPNSFYITDGNGNKLSFEEGLKYAENYETDDHSTNIVLHMNYTPKKDGHIYLFTHELISLGTVKAGETVQKSIPFFEHILYFRDGYNLVTINDENMKHVLSLMSENQWENVKTENNCVTGTTNYEEDGYTMLSIAWDRNWHAYIDGEEVEIEDFYGAMMFVKTPAGKHTLTLKYIPYGMKESKLISLCFWIFTFGLFGVMHIIKKRKQKEIV